MGSANVQGMGRGRGGCAENGEVVSKVEGVSGEWCVREVKPVYFQSSHIKYLGQTRSIRTENHLLSLKMGKHWKVMRAEARWE